MMRRSLMGFYRRFGGIYSSNLNMKEARLIFSVLKMETVRSCNGIWCCVFWWIFTNISE
jgi:hypothetical protein